MRLRFSNALGTGAVTFDGVHVGLQRTAAALVAGSNQPVGFAGKSAITVAPGSSVWNAFTPLGRAPGGVEASRLPRPMAEIIADEKSVTV